MDFIGISLNNIISTSKEDRGDDDKEEVPLQSNQQDKVELLVWGQDEGSESEGEESDENSRPKKRPRKPTSPIVPIAIARTKR